MKPPIDSIEYLISLTALAGRREILSRCVEAAVLDGDWAEFGVYKGYTARIILETMPADENLHLFDSFEGLPEDWDVDDNHKKGTFACSIPDLKDDRAVFHIGWFKDTVPEYAAMLRRPLAFMNIDSDIYSSCRTVLTALRERIVPGTIIYFDEYYGYSTYMNHEFRAFHEFVDCAKLKFEYLYRAAFQVGVIIV